MIIQDRSFPHPVLASFRDDVLPNDFTLTLTVGSDADNYYLDVKFEYKNETINELVAKGKAVHCIHLECKRNFYREIFSFSEHNKRLTISALQLIGRVEITGFVKVSETIPDYQIKGSHEDYGSVQFHVKAGDVLAVAPSQQFDAYIDYDPLSQISSVLTIRRSEDMEEGAMKVDTKGDRIEAILSQKDFDRYIELKSAPELRSLLANQIVVPVLLEAVHEIHETTEEEFEVEMCKRWFRSMYKKLEDAGINIRGADASPLEALQELLKMPLRRSLEGLIQMNPLDDQP